MNIYTIDGNMAVAGMLTGVKESQSNLDCSGLLHRYEIEARRVEPISVLELCGGTLPDGWSIIECPSWLSDGRKCIAGEPIGMRWTNWSSAAAE